MSKQVNSVAKAIEVLGGTGKAAILLGATASNICRWRDVYGKFPATWYLRVKTVLNRRGYVVDAKVFKFIDGRSARSKRRAS